MANHSYDRVMANDFTFRVAIATDHLARAADEAWENMQRERPTLTGLNYAAGLTRAAAIVAEELGGDATRWHRRQIEISALIRAVAAERCSQKATEA